MASGSAQLILPRPGAEPQAPSSPIPGPTEAIFTNTFGTLLPPAQFFTTSTGKAAYYELPPTSKSPSKSPDRVVFLHGVQTPALGMLPLARALHSAFPQAHCVLMDWWGHGLSETPVVAHENKLFHAQVNALLDHLGWPSAHFVSYSFGCSTTISYVAAGHGRVKSMALVAPAGLLRSNDWTDLQRQYLKGGNGIEDDARRWILEFLEGGELVVPTDWKERVSRGEVVAEAIRQWQMQNHSGHTASVVGIFRDGGVFDQHSDFAKAAATGIETLFVLGELDDLCSKADLVQAGFNNITVVPGAGHAVVRDKVSGVAVFIDDFWRNTV
ncbi:valacyclovir hydrolase [Diaporthe amygdali]|uniref:valacyclovir hydrolase n=1 Tax=Phomopsis amygdali TaxID=1214568 RepID=UPI0022FE531E|nr:valacyclovir hydrolase [Diaporthe amygdali]KAJ0122014.1 valacyclovir hydrolase [Diaporthe amygdali]